MASRGLADTKSIRRVLSGLIAALSMLSLTALWAMPRVAVANTERVQMDAPTALPEPTTTEAPTTTTTTAPPGSHSKAGPVAVPADNYAPEPVVYIGTIEIPKIGLVSKMYHGITLNNIDHGPSHWPGTAWPGQPGNFVVAGHRVTHTHPFLNIDQLTPGDQVIFTVFGGRFVYVVTGHEVVDPSDVAIINQTSTPTATLFACHPPHWATYRYVVHLAYQSMTFVGTGA
jgi:sortase A